MMDDGYEDYEVTHTRKESRLGIASFVVALLAGLMELITVGVAGFVESTTEGGMDEESPIAIIIGLALFAGVFAVLVGGLLGLIGLLQPNRGKIFAIIGMLLNGMILLGVVGLVVIGLAME